MAGCLAVAVALVVLSGCGDDGGATATDDPTVSPTTDPVTPSEPPFPDACEDIWVDGQTLPARYRGCTGADGAGVKADKYHCSYGMPIVVYGGRFYAVAGKMINEVEDLASSSSFRQALRACQA